MGWLIGIAIVVVVVWFVVTSMAGDPEQRKEESAAKLRAIRAEKSTPTPRAEEFMRLVGEWTPDGPTNNESFIRKEIESGDENRAMHAVCLVEESDDATAADLKFAFLLHSRFASNYASTGYSMSLAQAFGALSENLADTKAQEALGQGGGPISKITSNIGRVLHG